MRKLYIKIIALTLFMFSCSCSASDEPSSKANDKSQSVLDTNSDYATDENSSISINEKLSSISSQLSDSSSQSEINNKLISCKVYMDTTSLHDGVDISDDEIIQKIENFKEYVLNEGTKFEKRPDNVPKGSYIGIKLDNENSISIASSDMTWVTVNDEYYEVGNERVKELYDYIHDYLLKL